MKIAIPVKMNKLDSAVAPLFGKAKWFAIVEEGKIAIVQNPAQGGRAVIEWLNSLHIDTIIMQEMGAGPYEVIQQLGTMKLYHAGFERITLDRLLQDFQENKLALLDEVKMSEIIAKHENAHTHTDDHHHNHTH